MLPVLAGIATLVAPATAQTNSNMGFAPSSFGNMIFTSTPSDATGPSGVSSVYTSTGQSFAFGTGGALVNPANFTYTVTGDNTATINVPATDGNAESMTQLVFTGDNVGTYATTSGGTTTTGTFNLAAIPSSAPIANVSSRTKVADGDTSIVGFVIAGNAPRRVLIRAVGSGLSAFGVNNGLANPMLSLHGSGQLLSRNDNWGTMAALSSDGGTGDGTGSGGATGGGTSVATGTTSDGVFTGTMSSGDTFTTQLATADDFTSTGAFALESGGNDAALVAMLPPGAYTVAVSASTASGGTSGGATGGGTGTGTDTTDGTGSGTGTGGTGTGTGSDSSGARDVLVEVYFVE